MSGELKEQLPVRPPAPVTSTVGGDPPPAAAAAETASPALLTPRLAEITWQVWQGGRRGAPMNREATRTHAGVAMVLRREWAASRRRSA
jgi:hypothetical protein